MQPDQSAELIPHVSVSVFLHAAVGINFCYRLLGSSPLHFLKSRVFGILTPPLFITNKMTPKRKATISFQKEYLSRLQDKNGQFCASFAFLKVKNAFSFRGFAPSPPWSGSAAGPCWGLHPRTLPSLLYIGIGSCSALTNELPLFWGSLRLWMQYMQYSYCCSDVLLNLSAWQGDVR